ncbi:interleukin-34 isoform X2 [Xenopus laevis]|uniref:Interleukin-34 isoform X2 n=1 Tax=Xenopus laevis TaxID=8355 RepID=A0A8J0V224_XENLA|nr:interleukin-34 isoform X2 [Xenopus laevis]
MQRGILLFLCTLVLGRTAVVYNKCRITRALNDKLLYDKRLTYMGDYFPKDYKIFVRYEEVLRCQNITSLNNQGITVEELRYLWGIINEEILIKIKKVLPDRHPSMGYIMELQKIFKELLRDDIEIQTEIIQDIMERLSRADDIGPWKSVRPKALLDNCYRVLHALYEEECNLCKPSRLMAL